MTCDNCGAKHVYRIEHIGGQWQCKLCPNKKHAASTVGLFIRAINPGSRGSRTVAHDRDISRRMLESDGRTVTRR